jgi:hypothetical protein
MAQDSGKKGRIHMRDLNFKRGLARSKTANKFKSLPPRPPKGQSCFHSGAPRVDAEQTTPLPPEVNVVLPETDKIHPE